MLERKTHFEQVPLETVRKIVEEQVRRETSAKQKQGIDKKTVEEELLEAQ
jgi:cobalamin biosynthesis protein CobD/CbiB